MKYTVIIGIILVFAGCKKYPEGGYLGSGIEGPHALAYLGVNGVDSTNMLNGNPLCCNDLNGFEFTGSALKSECATITKTTYAISHDKKTITITCTPTFNGQSVYPFVMNKNVSITWEIRRYTRNDFWIKTMYNGKEYYLKFYYIH